MSDADNNRREAPAHRHEGSDTNIRILAYIAAAMIAGAVIMHAGLAGLLLLFERHPTEPKTPPSEFVRVPQEPPQPRLQQTPSLDMERFAESEARTLDTYGWVDEGAGVAHIPIDRAMDIIAAQGLPSRPPTPATGAPSGAPRTGAPYEPPASQAAPGTFPVSPGEGGKPAEGAKQPGREAK